MRKLRPIFLASFFFSFHLALLSYLNSTILSEHVSDLQTTLTYSISSTLSIILIFWAPKIANKFGEIKFLSGALILSFVLLSLMGTIADYKSFVLVFILYFALNTVIWYGFDLLIEHFSENKLTGNIRGLYLTLNNAGWVTAPLIASFILEYAGFSKMYILASLIVLISLIFILTKVKIPSSAKPKIIQSSLIQSFRRLLTKPQARRITTLYFIIQFFYALMIIYLAQYLINFGFDWTTIGIIFSVMLVPFVLLQYVAGKIADRYGSEKQIIFYGFAIAAFSTLLLAFDLKPLPILLAVILFITRIGASLIEVGCESAFFREVSDHDAPIISVFRMTLPLAYIIAPLCGAFLLWFGSLKLIFGFLALILFIAMFYSLRLRKNKTG